MASVTTRRALLSGVGLAAAATLAQCGGTPAFAAASVSPRLARLIALQGRAWAAYDRYTDEVEEQALDAYYAARGSYVPEPEPPHREVATTFVNAEGNTIRFSTKREFLAPMARRVRDLPEWASSAIDQPDWHQAHVELANLADERDAIIAQQKARKQAHDDAASERVGLPAITYRSQVLCDREYRLWEAVINEPANSLADIVAKLDMNDRLGRVDNERVIVALAGDVRRLAGGRA